MQILGTPTKVFNGSYVDKKYFSDHLRVSLDKGH